MKTITFDPQDPEARWILSQPCFALSPVAHVLQKAGHDIPRKAEDEQCAVMIYFLEKLEEHGPAWRGKANEELKALVRKHQEQAPDRAEEGGEG